MKLDTKGIKFRVWLFFVVFIIAVVLLLGILQFSFIRPYYRNSKITTVKQIADLVEERIINQNGNDESALNAFQIVIENNVCVAIYNEEGNRVYLADSLGSGCVFNPGVESDADFETSSGTQLITNLNASEEEYSLTLTNERTSQDMILYGRKIQNELVNLYLFVNSPLEPVESVINFFSRQYVYFTLVIVIIATFVSFLFSFTLTKPIVKMNQEAKKLAEANYNVSFDGGNYTETKELADSLNGAAQKLSKVDEMRKDLIANVSHDIKTPLTSIKAYAEMIRDISGNQPQKREEHLNVIISEVDYMDHLVADMSQLSQLQSGTYVLKRSNFDLSEVIHNTVQLNKVLIDESKLFVHVDTPETLTVYADKIKITQVIQNFLSNAIKHTMQGKNITIRAFMLEDEETVRVEVEDEGEGMDEEELELIWNRYQKSSRSFSRSMTSTGLGLSIVKAILDVHHAKYGVTSTKGIGSTFYFELTSPKEEMNEEKHV